MTDEERKAIKAKLNQQIDELSDEELAQISGAGFGDTSQPLTCPSCKRVFYNKIKYGYHVMTEHYSEIVPD
ncbi:MAG: bacteriocin [Clostridiales bacterium]|nr:bacteriocin [Clostridiales bacterium]